MSKADMILKNGQILSITLEDKRITGQAVAIADGKIAAIGSDEEIMALAGEDTEIIDCQGKTIMPGMCDVHCHPSIAASTAKACDLFGIYREEEETAAEVLAKYKERFAEYVKDHQDARLIRGAGWVTGNFHTDDEMPTRQDLDEICPDIPVILESFCQHFLWVNSKAIEIAGVDENTPDPSTGKIYRDENGYPAGVFNDPEAMELIKLHVPGYDLSIEEYKEGILFYQTEYANRYGVTMVQDCMHSANAREAFRQLGEEGKLTIYLRGTYHLEPGKEKEQMEDFLARKGSDNAGDTFRIDTVKMFSEGTFNMIEPWEKDFLKETGLPEDHNGPLYWPDEVFVEYAAKAMEAGFQVHVHAMGDGSVKQSVECLAKAQKQAGLENPRSVVAHLMLVPEESIKEMAKFNIIANAQPRWMVYDSDVNAMVRPWGQERADASYPFRRLLDEGVRVAFGTDFPVTPPPDPMHGIQCAMTRSVFQDAPDYEKFKGKVLGTEKPATLEECVKASTINGAYQIFAEEYTGSIEVGKSADLVVLDRNIEETPLDEIYDIDPEMTIFKGKVVYTKKQ